MDRENQSVDEKYNAIQRVYCPYFKEHIYYTRTGLEHLKFKNKFKARTEKDLRFRTMLLPISVEIIAQSHTLQGKICRRGFEERYVNNRKEIALTDVTYYEFLAIINERRAKVVIKQIENGNKIFLSVIPVFKQKMPPETSDIL